MIDEVFRKNKTTQKIADAEERFLKISPLPDGSKVVDTRSSRLTYVADPVDDKDAINKSWATKYFKDEKDAVTKLSESATAKSAELDTKLVKFNSDKASIEQTGEELKVLSVETKTRAEETKAKLESTLAQLEQAKTKIDSFNTDYAKAKELKGDVEGKAVEVKANLESVRAVLVDVTSKSTDILLTYNNAKQDLTNLGNATKLDIRDVATRTKQEIDVAKASIDTKANEALNTATTSLNEIKTILNDFRGKQAELNALKVSLETLKSSLESLNKSGLINDTQAGIAQTYSSNKINNLLQGVLRESDASEGNTAGKLVKRNAQGNIYATNVYLNATTKAEVSDIKNSLATDKWRFIVRDTGEGLLRSMSIKDFISSQEVDAYKKSESDNRYLTEAKGDTKYLKTTDADSRFASMNTALINKVDYNKANKPFGYPQLDASSRIKAEQLPTEINATTFNGQPAGYYTPYSYVQTTEQSLRTLINQAQKAVSNIMEGNTGRIKTGALPDTLVYLSPSTREIPLSAVPLKEAMSETGGSTLNLDSVWGKHFRIKLFSQDTFKITGLKNHIGQTGVIIVRYGSLITGWDSFIKWREVPTDLKETEVFAYFVASETEVYMGRA